MCCSASVVFWETSDQLWTVLRLAEVFRLFWPAQPSAGGCGTGQHMENLTSTLCVWGPARSALPCRHRNRFRLV